MRVLAALLICIFTAGMAFAGDPSPRSLRDPFVTLVAKLCLKSNQLVCDDVVITDSDMSTVIDQPITFDPETKKVTMWASVPFSMGSCLSHAPEAIVKHMKDKHLEGDYSVNGWQCYFGNQKRPVDKRV